MKLEPFVKQPYEAGRGTFERPILPLRPSLYRPDLKSCMGLIIIFVYQYTWGYMTLGRCPLSIFCSRGTLSRGVPIQMVKLWDTRNLAVPHVSQEFDVLY